MERKYIVLIQPKEIDVDLVVNKPFLPLALLSIARHIHPRYNIVIIDQRVEKNWKGHLLKYLEKDIVCAGISCLLGNQIEYSMQVSRFIKEHSDVPVIWGGVHHPFLIRQVLESSIVDGVVQGEGEEAFAALVEKLDKKEDTVDIPGYWPKGSGCCSKGRESFLDMDLLPQLPYHLINCHNYEKYRGGSFSISYESSRGCNFKCSFCASQYYSHVWRGRSAHKVVEDMKYLTEKLGVKTVFIIDDNFFGDINRAKEIFRRLIDEKLRINLDIYGTRIDAIEKFSDTDLRCMVEAGVRKLGIGVESGSPRILKFIKKGITVEQVLKENRRIRRYISCVQYNFMTGFPTETVTEIKQTIRLALRLIDENKKAMINYFAIFTPLPGTSLYDYERKQGAEFPDKIEGWSNFDRIFGSKRRGTAVNKKLNIISLFVDRKVQFYTRSLFLRVLTALYRPVAKFRLYHFFLNGFLEGKVFMAINKIKFKLWR